MKTFFLYFSVFFFVVLLLLCSLRLQKRYQYAETHDLIMTKGETSRNDSLKVLFIGDSWAYLHQNYDSQFCSMIIKKGFPCRVISKGYSGANSKEIYQHMYTSCMPLLIDNPTYCVIIVGINDAVAKLGKDFYSYHYILILQQLLRMGIKPVVLEIPDVNYRAVADRESPIMRLHHCLSSFLTDSELYGFNSYRENLKKSIVEAGINRRIVYVKSDSWNTGGYKDSDSLFLPDEVHLNALGYYKLDSCIASIIIKDLVQQ